MIIQGSNTPITFIFSDINDTPGDDVSVLLSNRVQTLKRWGASDLVVSEDGLQFSAPVSQEESASWEEGPCVIEMKWLDAETQQTAFLKVRTEIMRWNDETVLVESEDE